MDPDKKYKDMLKENPYLSIQKPEDVSGVIDRYEHAKKDEACWQVKELFSDFIHVMNVCNELSSFRPESMVLTLILKKNPESSLVTSQLGQKMKIICADKRTKK